MSPALVRWGGIAVFVGIGVALIMPIIMVAMIGSSGAFTGGGSGRLESAMGDIQIMTVVMNLVLTVIIVFVFWTTKGFFNALGYRRADLAILILIIIQVLSAIVGSVMNTSAGLTGLTRLGSASATGVAGIVIIVTSLALLVALLLFALRCLDFGKLGGGLWKAIGILYLIALVGFIVAFIIIAASVGLTFLSGTTPGGGLAAGGIIGVLMILVAILCYAAAIICHGIGLITGAGRMERDAAGVVPNAA